MIYIKNESYYKECDICKKITNIKYSAYRYNLKKEKHYCLSCVKIGNKNPFYNKKHSKEFKEKQSKNLTSRLIGQPSNKRGILLSENHKLNIKKSTKGKINLGEKNGMYGILKEKHPMYGKNCYANRTKEENNQISIKQSQTRAKNNTNLRPHRFSKISQKLFWDIYNLLEDKSDIYFGQLNYELCLKNDENKHFYYDFAYKNKIIEFHGDKFHANPLKYGENDKPSPFDNLISKQIWQKDKYKMETIKQYNYEILIIWEHDYNVNYKLTLDKCMKFLI